MAVCIRYVYFRDNENQRFARVTKFDLWFA